MGDAAGFRWELHPEARVKFEVASDWTTQEGDKNKTVRSADGVTIEFRYISLGVVEALHDEKLLTKELETFVENIKITNGPSKFEQNGLAGFGAGGSGQRAGGAVYWVLYTVGDRQGHGVIALGYGAEAAWKAQLKNILRTMKSIQPLQVIEPAERPTP